MSKPELHKEGFLETHNRSMSSKHYMSRGFGDYAFLTLDMEARILRAKLKGGSPHIDYEVPVSAVENTQFDLCRYNVAMTRQLRRGDKVGWPESPENGMYYDGKQIPIARTEIEKKDLLAAQLNKGTMIEVLVPVRFDLPSDTQINCFSEADANLASKVLELLDSPWSISLVEPPDVYANNKSHRIAVELFVKQAIKNPDWRGNGLEFDRV